MGFSKILLPLLLLLLTGAVYSQGKSLQLILYSKWCCETSKAVVRHMRSLSQQRWLSHGSPLGSFAETCNMDIETSTCRQSSQELSRRLTNLDGRAHVRIQAMAASGRGAEDAQLNLRG